MTVRYSLILVALIALFIFSYMRNKQADRNDQRRQRLEDKKEELMEMLRKNSSKQEDTKENKTEDDH